MVESIYSNGMEAEIVESSQLERHKRPPPNVTNSGQSEVCIP
jgi:hypothetical protein